MLTEALTAVAAAGGTAVVQAAGTDAWKDLRQRVAALLGRGDQQREQAELERLDLTAAAVAQSAGQGAERAAAQQATAWRGRFEVLLEGLDEPTRAQAAAELLVLIEQIGTPVADSSVSDNTFVGPTAFQFGNYNRQDNHFGS